MPDYAFYRDRYLGEDIPEPEFPQYLRRAQAKLARFAQMFTVQARPGVPFAQENALCAVADALYDFAQEDARRAPPGAAEGAEALSPTTLYLRERHCYELASDFLLMRHKEAYA